MPKPIVTRHDNRSSRPEAAYGFVYFNDDRRVAYTTKHGIVTDATGGWDGAITGAHVDAAYEHLKDRGILAPEAGR